jgi:ATPase subunit of ABC transporter with duplicated ATPase domains
MLTVSNVSLAYGKRVLFKEVNLKFTAGNCYGVIGANGAGKSTFLKILAKDIEPNTGEVSLPKKARMAVLEQDQFKYDETVVLDTVYMGHKTLHAIMQERTELYSKAEMTEDEGMRAADLEAEFGELNGYEAESEAASLLEGLGITEDLHYKTMKELEAGQKVRVLLAQAIFGNPDVLILDEPTNNLDIQTIGWLEDFLIRFENTVIVVSHDRHFLNNVCTHIADIDFGKIQTYVGNYDFWYQMSQLASKQLKDENKKKEDKAAELKKFIQRFSSNASKAKQATSRKKLLEKLTIDDVPRTSRKFPYIAFKPERESGKTILTVEKVSKEIEGETLLKDFSLNINQKDKIAFIGQNDVAMSTFFQIINGELEADSGKYTWGSTISPSYFPKENKSFFDCDLSIIDWLRQFTTIDDESFVRGFLGRMLFSGEESLKKVNVLSGGEKVRCMLSKMMLTGGNVLILDEPTGHLDLEAITSLNDGLVQYEDVILFTSQDHQFVSTIANRIVELTPNGYIDRYMSYDEYLADPDVKKLREKMYGKK